MSNSNLIQIRQFCVLHEIDQTFIMDLKNYDLVEVVVQENDEFLQHEQLPLIEKMIRLHYDLNVNLEGIDVITNLLDKIENLQQHLNLSQNRLRLYERDDF